MIILCELCDARCICYEQWVDHILTQSHQDVTKSNIDVWDTDLNERSLLVTITSSSKPKTEDFCWYFANYGLVSDVYFDPDMEFCVIQLDKRDYVLKALQIDHKISDLPVSIKWKVDVTREEWLALTLKNLYQSKSTNENSLFDDSFREQHEEFVHRFRSLSLDMQLEHFVRGMKLKDDELTTRQKLLVQIKDVLDTDFPDCVLYANGSTVLGIGESTSALDVYVDCLGATLPEETPLLKVRDLVPLSKYEIALQIIKRLHILNHSESFCYDIAAETNAKEPKICFTHRKTGVKCRFTFENLLPIKTTNVISFLMKLDQRISPLMVLIRYWARYHMLTGDSLISNYSLNLLVIVFLVQKKIIPSIAALQSLSDNIVEVGGWDTSYCSNREKVLKFMHSSCDPPSYEKHCITGAPTAKAILILFNEFCKLYARVDFESNVVSALVGDFLPKRYFIPGNEPRLPDCMDVYKKWALLRRPEARFNYSSFICVQDPFQLSSNVSEMCSQELVWKFQIQCSDAGENLNNILRNSSPRLMDIFLSRLKRKSQTLNCDKPTTQSSPHYKPERDYYNFDDASNNNKQLTDERDQKRTAHVDMDPDLTFKHCRRGDQFTVSDPPISPSFLDFLTSKDNMEFVRRDKKDMYEGVSVKRRKVALNIEEEEFTRRVKTDVYSHKHPYSQGRANPYVSKPFYPYRRSDSDDKQDINKQRSKPSLDEINPPLYGNPVRFKIKPTAQKDTSSNQRNGYF